MHCWTLILHLLRMFETFQTKNGLQHLYDEKRPTARKVIHLLKGEPTNDAERSCFDHLKRYIRSLPCNLLHIFLQFLTGSDMIAVEHIQISFNQLDGLSRRPVARTCVPLLELPSTYQSYNELAEEFGNLLPTVVHNFLTGKGLNWKLRTDS